VTKHEDRAEHEPWRELERRGAGPFVTWVAYRRPDGLLVRWESRRQRKQHNRLDPRTGSTWWAPSAVGWWIGVLFMMGATCFAVGALPGYVDWVGTTPDNVTFFVGSIFFTGAAFLQYLEVVNTEPVTAARSAGRVRVLAWEPHRIDWWATLIQFAGTICFNVSTLVAIDPSITSDTARHHVWRPDVLGSVCFLVASELAFAEVGHRWLSWLPHLRSWWIAALNLAGSVAFGVSAIAAYVVPDSGAPANVQLVNLGTFLGAIGFFVGALLLLPERTDQPEPNSRPTVATT
jgi:hypothetical protein